MELENKKLCAECGGECCKRCGCDLSAEDFPRIDIDYLQSKLDEGFVSISCKVEPNSSKYIMLYMRMRNKYRPVVDLAPFGYNPCASLTSSGCKYDFEQRPTGGRMLVPLSNKECYYPCSPDTFALSWMPYQQILRELVIRNTGLMPEEKLSFDVEDGFYHVIEALENCCYVSAAMFYKFHYQFFEEEKERAKERYARDHGSSRIRSKFI